MAPDRAVLILYPGCIAYEAMLAVELVAEHMPVIVATPDGADHQASSGLRIRADASFGAVDPASCRLVMVPGGDPESVLHDATLAEVLRGAHDGGSLIAAICAGPLLLASAGLLAGRRFTHGYKTWHQEFLAPFWEGATYVDELVVRDGRILTAMAEGHVDFAIEILAALNQVEPAKRERRRAFYKGVIQPPSPMPEDKDEENR